MSNGFLVLYRKTGGVMHRQVIQQGQFLKGSLMIVAALSMTVHFSLCDHSFLLPLLILTLFSNTFFSVWESRKYPWNHVSITFPNFNNIQYL